MLEHLLPQLCRVGDTFNKAEQECPRGEQLKLHYHVAVILTHFPTQEFSPAFCRYKAAAIAIRLPRSPY